MKTCKNLQEFYRHNDKDLTNILLKKFSNVVKHYSLEDLKADIYLRLHKKEYIEKYRPLDIRIDPEKGLWNIKPAPAKFSTYICKFIYNYIYAYFNKVSPDSCCISLDNYKDNFFCKEDQSKIRFKEVYTPDMDLKLQLEKIYRHLEENKKDKGTLICENSLSTSIIRIIDKFGEKGCSEKNLINKLKYKNLTVLEELGLKEALNTIEKKGIIKKSGHSKHPKYYLDNPERRSIYNLFRYYMRGYKDKEISEKFRMTVAGIGALKRTLRKEIEILCKK